MPRRPVEEPWYAGGLRFRCTACGQCCTGEPGHVWVEEAEIARMARALGLSRRAFEDRYVRRVGARLSLREQPGGDCVMLEAGRCRVYETKPRPCSTFPFWEGALRSEREWAATKVRCEGIDQGDWYSRAEIERIAAGDAAPLLERHRRPPEQPVVSRFKDGRPLPEAEADPPPAPATPTPPPAPDAPPVPAAPPAPPPEPDWDAAFEALEALYAELERELPGWGFTCAASGACCDFDAYGHRLYATRLEAAWFFARTPRRANADPRLCPAFGRERLCHSRAGRMLGCRVYHCGPYPRGLPEDLYARYFERLRALHERHGVPYAYRDIVEWAAELLPAPAGNPPPGAGVQ